MNLQGKFWKLFYGTEDGKPISTSAVAYRLSLLFFILLLLALSITTPIDTILRSKNTGQFWNSIIIVIACVATAVVALIIYFGRILVARRALAAIPRRYLIFIDDELPSRVARLIHSELDRCDAIVQKATDPQAVSGKLVSHAGLMNPILMEGSESTPYFDIVKITDEFIQLKAKSLHSSFERPVGMPLREYLHMLLSFRLLEDDNAVRLYVEYDELARFSGRQLNEEEFEIYMENALKVISTLSMYEEDPQRNGSITEALLPITPQLSRQSDSESSELISRTSTVERGFWNKSFRDQSLLQPYQSYHSQVSGLGHMPDVSRHTTAISPLHALTPASTRYNGGSGSVSDSDSGSGSGSGSDGETPSTPSDSSVIIRTRRRNR